jgi:PPP family 3-phenylpropionic acid transporter
LLGGRVLAGRSSEWVLYLLLGMAALTAASCAAMPRGTPLPSRPRAAWRVLLTRRHLVFLTAAMLVQSSHAVYYGFGTLYWQRLGFGDGTIAVLWAEGAVAEVVLFLVGGRYVRRWGPGALLALGGAGGLVRWTLTAWVGSLPALLLIQPLHALTFAAAHLGAMHYLGAAVPQGQAGTAQSLYSAVVGGIGMGVASLLAGALYGAWGGNAYLGMAAMAAAGGVVALRIKNNF